MKGEVPPSLKRAVSAWREGGSRSYSRLVQIILGEIALPKSCYRRSYPKMTQIDTMIFNLPYPELFSPEEQWEVRRAVLALPLSQQGPFSAAHRPSLSFYDEDIVEVHELTPPSPGTPRYVSGYFKGRMVAYQSGIRGCAGAARAMIASSHLKKNVPPWRCNISGMEAGRERLRSVGLVPITNRVSTLRALKGLIEMYGPAEVAVNRGCEWHSVVVDEIGDEVVVFRDSYHAWVVSIKVSLFCQVTELESRPIWILQAQQPPPAMSRARTCPLLSFSRSQ